MLSPDFIYQLKNANPIDQIMGGYVKIVRAGSLYKCCCPFHAERTPSCVIYTTPDPHFYCFGCHTGGDVITFLMKIENLTYMEAVQKLADRAGMTVPAQDGRSNAIEKQRSRLLELNRDAARYYYTMLTGPDKRGLLYLMGRGLTPQTIKTFGLGYAGAGWDGLYQHMAAKGYSDDELITANLCARGNNGSMHDRFHDRVMFPIMDMRGGVIAFGGRTLAPDGKPKYLNSSDTPVFNKRKNLYAMNLAAKEQSRRIILAEGYMDVISMYQAGFHNVVASLGTSLTPEQCQLMKQRRAQEVVIAYDADFAGQDAAMRAIRFIREAGLRAFRLTVENAKDPDEYIKKFGADHFKMLLDNAVGAVEFELKRAKSSVDTATDEGRVEALHRSVEVLAQIDNDMERDVYISSTAREYDLSPAVIGAQVNVERDRQKQLADQQEKQQERAAAQRFERAAPDIRAHTREAKAEELILAYLFRFPGEIDRVLAVIEPEDFVTSLHRRIFSYYADMIDAGYDYSISLFSPEIFSLDEIAHIETITKEYESITIERKSVKDSAEVLKKYRGSAKPINNDSDLAEKFAELRKQKNS